MDQKSELKEDRNAAHFNFVSDDVFSRIAYRYDRLCDIFSLCIHRYWKNAVAKRIAADPGKIILDLASGTGDIPLRIVRRMRKEVRLPNDKIIYVTDICPQMLSIAQSKSDLNDPQIRFAHVDAHNIVEHTEGSIDVCSLSFGMKILDRERVLDEVMRVLKPGGVLYCLEASKIPFKPIHALYLMYMDFCMPLLARLATKGDASAYDYLLRGVHEFPGQKAFQAELENFGFANVSYKNLSFGITAIHRCTKPPAV